MFRDYKNARAFKKAQETVADGDIVCGTYSDDGDPLYFTAPRESTEEEIRDRAFAARNGRPLSRVERHLVELAASRSADGGIQDNVGG
jgi:hypothetical protein|tara:strand:+ start:68 stop:331 length:264 start_codon:yes stop_codon:yes gene_type:complete